MDSLGRYIKGNFGSIEIRRYLAFQAMVFWGLIFVCWLIYPAENRFSIMTHTFSFLGRFDSIHNPKGWWLFSMAMVFWGASSVPLVFYRYRRFAAISPRGATVGAFMFLLVCMGTVLVGLFPDSHEKVWGNLELTQVHTQAAFLIAAGSGLGIILHGALLIADALSRRQFGDAHIRFVGPYALWSIVTGTGLYFLITWEYVYAGMKAAAVAAGRPVESSWSAALNTRYSFPLWENLAIYALFAFLVWFTALVPNKVPVRRR